MNKWSASMNCTVSFIFFDVVHGFNAQNDNYVLNVWRALVNMVSLSLTLHWLQAFIDHLSIYEI